MNRDTPITITTGTIIKIVLILVATYLVYFFSELLLIVITAVVVASAVEPAIKFFERYKISRIFGVTIMFASLLLAIGLILALVVPTIAREINDLVGILPNYLQDTNLWITNAAGQSPVLDSLLGGESVSIQNLLENISKTMGLVGNGVGNVIGAFFGSVVNFMLIIVLAFYFSSQEYGIDNFLRIVIPPRHSKYAVNLWRRSQRKIGLWMQGQLVIMLLTFSVTFVMLLLVGVPYAFILALLAALAELVPVVGIFIASVPALAVAALTGGLSMVIMVAVLYLIYQQIQGNVISPMVVNKVVGVPPLLVILGLIVGTQLFGILGAILSVPFAAALMEYINDVKRDHDREIMRRKIEEDNLADKIAEKVIEKSEEKEREDEEKEEVKQV